MNSNGTSEQHPLKSFLKHVSTMPANAIDYLKGKSSNLLLSAQMAERASTITLDTHQVNRIREALVSILQTDVTTPLKEPLTPLEESVIRSIKADTDRCNLNNITRTKAYYDMYRSYPELHWALLAHMVSRNGGWNMTDLQGEFLPRLLSASQREALFQLLERANALIFQDAYPQLKLYEASLTQDVNLFHLLPHFHVSAFMKPVWDSFWKDRCSELLTVALIINEQQYIEGRVIEREPYSSMLDSILFPVQAALQMNAIVFPFRSSPASSSGNRLAGLVMETFSDLDERIGIGKKLYCILFSVPDIFEGALTFSSAAAHTGSRADYWPHLFHIERSDAARQPTLFTEKLEGSKRLEDAGRLYSPRLIDVWPNQPVVPPDRYDWLTDLTPLSYFSDPSLPLAFEITNEYGFILGKLETAVMSEQLLET